MQRYVGIVCGLCMCMCVCGVSCGMRFVCVCEHVVRGLCVCAVCGLCVNKRNCVHVGVSTSVCVCMCTQK